MNKQGRIWHWVAIIVVVIMISAAAMVKIPALSARLEWHFDFIENSYLESEKDLLKNDILAKGLGRQVAVNIAEKGGYIKLPSECGKTDDDFVLWNKLKQECYPEFKKNAEILAQIALKDKIKDKRYKDVKFNEESFSAKGGIKTITTEDTRYFYETSFAVNIDYDFNEYQGIINQAKELLKQCRNRKDFVSCLEKPVLWYYGYCNDEQQLDPSNRVVEFCVNTKNTGIELNYYFALDFTPTEPFMIDEVTAIYDQTNDVYEIFFEKDEFATAYKIYFTNKLDLLDKQNVKKEDISVFQVAGEILNDDTLILTSKILEEGCEEKEVGKAYLCEGKIHYLLQHPDLYQGEEYLFAATTLQNNEESAISSFFIILNPIIT